MRYPGGKNGGGAYQKIINLIPPHETYVELFLGSGAVLRHKKPAPRSFAVEIDSEVMKLHVGDPVARTDYITGNAVDFVYSPRCQFHPPVFIYADPPYLMETRSSGAIYRHEMSEEEHFKLLTALKGLACSVAISGYDSSLYHSMLSDWRTYEFQMMTRGGTMRTEVIWMNYPKPERLHDYSFLGKNRTDRQVVRRKISRLRAKLSAMPAYERQAVMDGLKDLR